MFKEGLEECIGVPQGTREGTAAQAKGHQRQKFRGGRVCLESSGVAGSGVGRK